MQRAVLFKCHFRFGMRVKFQHMNFEFSATEEMSFANIAFEYENLLAPNFPWMFRFKIPQKWTYVVDSW